jgi:hypothetical protein
LALELTAVNGGEIMGVALAIPRLKAGGYTRPNQPSLGKAPFHGANGKRSRASCASFFKNSELYCHSSCRFVQLRGRSLPLFRICRSTRACSAAKNQPANRRSHCAHFSARRLFGPSTRDFPFNTCRLISKIAVHSSVCFGFRASNFGFALPGARRRLGPLDLPSPESWTRLAGATVCRAHLVHLFFGFRAAACVPQRSYKERA